MILWEKYSEDELRTIVKLYYTNNGFCVDDLHEADKRGEKGADLIVYRSGEAEKTAIALKVKPIKSDIYQLQELAKRSERQKKYIYILTPSTDFYFEMEQYRNKVDFWDTRKLTYEITVSSPSLAVWLTCSSHPLFACIGQINVSLALSYYKWRKKQKFQGNNSVDAKFYREIWRLKDDFSSLNKSLSSLQYIFESKLSEAEGLPSDPLNLLYLFERALDSMMTPSLEESNLRISELINNYGKFISNVIEETSDRSNWRSYPTFDWSLVPGKIKSDLVSEVDKERTNLNLKMSFKMTLIEKLDEEIRGKRYQGLFFEIGNVARILRIFADNIEYFIDCLFTFSLQNTFGEKIDPNCFSEDDETFKDQEFLNSLPKTTLTHPRTSSHNSSPQSASPARAPKARRGSNNPNKHP